VAGFVIASLGAFVPFVVGRFGLGRPRVVVAIGALLACAWVVDLAAQPSTARSHVPLWFLAGLVALLYAIWCGGLWLGLRFRRLRRRSSG
jgi:hypothetical protein